MLEMSIGSLLPFERNNHIVDVANDKVNRKYRSQQKSNEIPAPQSTLEQKRYAVGHPAGKIYIYKFSKQRNDNHTTIQTPCTLR